MITEALRSGHLASRSRTAPTTPGVLVSVDAPFRAAVAQSPPATAGAPPSSPGAARRLARARASGPSELADLTGRVQALGLMERRYGYYALRPRRQPPPPRLTRAAPPETDRCSQQELTR